MNWQIRLTHRCDPSRSFLAYYSAECRAAAERKALFGFPGFMIAAVAIETPRGYVAVECAL